MLAKRHCIKMQINKAHLNKVILEKYYRGYKNIIGKILKNRIEKAYDGVEAEQAVFRTGKSTVLFTLNQIIVYL